MRDSPTTPSAGDISARIDRLPPTRTIWTAILLLSFGMFFELYDLLFSGYIAPSLVKSGLLTRDDAGAVRHDGRCQLHRGPVHGAVHRHDRLRLSRRQVRAADDLYRFAALVHGGQYRGRLPERRVRPQRLAADLRHRARRRDGDDRRLFERNGAQGHARQSVRLLAGDRLLLRADHFVPRLYARADRAVRARGLALGGADRRVRRGR